jgi:hypothetical protein
MDHHPAIAYPGEKVRTVMERRSQTLKDPDFGKLSWNKKLLFWVGQCTMADGTSIPLYLNTLANLTQLPPFEDATWDRTITPESRKAFPRLLRSDALLRKAVSREFFTLYREGCDSEKISAAEFKRRLQLESVTLNPDGVAEVFFNDAGMFGGHALVAHLDPDGVVRHVEMFG